MTGRYPVDRCSNRAKKHAAAAHALWVAMALATGCDALSGGDTEAEEGQAAEQGPCAQYAARICTEAGEASQTCTSVKATAELLPPKACEAALADVSVSLEKLQGQRGKCDELMGKLCKELGDKSETCQMVREQTKQFPPERCAMMLEHYDEVLADLKAREAMNKPLNAEQQAAIAAPDAPAFGPKDAKVTVVEFSDFECPYCSKAAAVAHQVREKYGDKVRFVFRQYPLPMHPNARVAAQASLAADAQGKFWEFHDRLFENQRKLDRESLESYAKDLGLNVQEFTKALEDGRLNEAVDRDMKLGEKVAVRGTPTMFVNGKRVSNPTSFEAVSQLIDEALKG
jgi:protein-disulfide isomerase